jgi:hypothetical protein
MKRLFVIVVLAIGVLGLSATPSLAAKGGTDRPYKASGSLSGLVDVDPSSPGFGSFDIQGPSNSTHLGNAPTEVTGSLLSPGFTTTITAANGDKVFGAFDHDVLGTTGPCPAGFSFNETVSVFTGGTGRFANASGSIDVKGCNRLDFTTGVLVVTFTASGTISY